MGDIGVPSSDLAGSGSCESSRRPRLLLFGTPENVVKHRYSEHITEGDISSSMPAGASRLCSLHSQHILRRIPRDLSQPAFLSDLPFPFR